ncbi:MAG: hypothetical protein H6541_10300 [Lentimicrobiaceae bacterium]|nr:hypothetical protein [Lentimicrobiaceae bacterium]MCO5267089.1 hypothetical protein [Lentimicrobium sp.]
MKKLMIVLGIMLMVVALNAQNVTISGTQNKGNAGKNAELKSTPVKITKDMKIITATGDCEGFWIVKDNAIVHQFYNLEKPIGTILKPGTYYIYPNLKRNMTSASITITLK